METPPVLKPDAIVRIEKEIAAAEAATSVEIVAVLARKSADYLHVPWQGGLLGAGLAFLVLCGTWWIVEGSLPVLHAGWFAAPVLAGFVAGTLATRLRGLQRFLAGEKVMLFECEERAKQLFLEHGVFRTSARTGVIVLVSLFKRMVIVLGDEAVSKGVNEAEYRGVVDAMGPTLRQGRVEEAYLAGLRHLGALLAQRFPRAPGDANELPDRLYVV